MLVGFPAAYLLGSAWIDAWASATGRRDWHRTANHMSALGIGSACVAAVPGLIDYLSAVPPRSSAKARATKHMLANVSALALFGLARFGRRRADDRPRWWAVAAELCGAGLVTAAGWMGGTLVFRNQIGIDHRYANSGKWRAIAADATDGRAIEVDAAAVEALGIDQMELIRGDGERIALARTERGLTAFSDRCTHRGGPLADGVLACGVVQCPWHGSQFDVTTGAVKRGPATEPIDTFDVESAGSRVRIDRREALSARRGSNDAQRQHRPVNAS